MRKPENKRNQFKTDTQANSKEGGSSKGHSLDLDMKQETLNGSDQRFRELVELLPEPVFEVNTSGLVTFANQRALELTGYNTEDLQAGAKALDLFAAEERNKVETNIAKLYQGENQGPNEYKMLRKDGGVFWALVHSRPIIIKSRPVGFTGVLVDISNRKRTEEELRLKTVELTQLVHENTNALIKTTEKLGAEVTERRKVEKRLAKSETLYQTLVETAKDVIWTVDLNFKYTFVSPSVVRQLGFTVEEMMNMDPLDNMNPESRERLLATFRQEVSTEKKHLGTRPIAEEKKLNAIGRTVQKFGSKLRQHFYEMNLGVQ